MREFYVWIEQDEHGMCVGEVPQRDAELSVAELSQLL